MVLLEKNDSSAEEKAQQQKPVAEDSLHFLQRTALIDAYSYFYKFHFAFESRPLTNKNGEVTSIIFSFLTFIINLVEKKNYSQVICILDSKGPTFRHQLDDTYKANRPPMPQEIRAQSAELRILIPALGIPMVERPTFEADDIIAQYSRSERKATHAVDIFSSDKDLMQLVNPNTFMLAADRMGSKFTSLGRKGVYEKYGVYPEQITDFLSLLGDTADNVPGVRGIGKVTASKLLAEFGTLEEIYAQQNKLNGATAKKITEGEKSAFHSKKMIVLNHFVPEIPKLADLHFTKINQTLLKEKLQHYECISILEKIKDVSTLAQFRNPAPAKIKKGVSSEESLFSTKTKNPSQKQNDIALPKKNPFLSQRTIINCDTSAKTNNILAAEIEKVISILTDAASNNQTITFDLETTSLDPYAAEVIAITFCCENTANTTNNLVSFYIRFAVSTNPTESTETLEKSRRLFLKLKPFLENPSIKKNGHNLKFEYAILAQQGITLQGIAHDTMVHEYLKFGSGKLKLENLSERYLNHTQKSYKELTADQQNLALIEKNELEEYALQDSEVTHQIYCQQKNTLSKKMENLFQTLELPLITTLAEMELVGIPVDIEFFQQLTKTYRKEIAQITEKIYALAGEGFNINSTKELQEILYGKLQLVPPPGSKNKTGFSTDHRILEKLTKVHPIATHLLEYRKIVKLLNTYVEVLPTLVNPKTHRIHTSFNQTIAATGRLSSNTPNLQNIPVYKGEDQLGLRKGFITNPNEKMISIDYSQVELRVLAQLSNDEALKNAYLHNVDIHKQTAGLVFEKSENEVTELERNQAKTINFSVIYGISAYALSDALRLSQTHPELTAQNRYDYAKNIIEAYYKSYPGIASYRNTILEEAKQNLHVKTYFGRKRSLPAIVSSNQHEAKTAERMAFNSVIQGTAADIIKIAMNNIAKEIRTGKLPCKMLLQVHDELVFTAQKDIVENLLPKLEILMTNIDVFSNILKVDTHVGNNWEK